MQTNEKPKETAEGVVICVHAFPGARRNEVCIGQRGEVRVSVTQIPEKGKANEAIRKLLAKSLKIRSSQVELRQGETSSQKKFLLRDISLADLRISGE